MDVNAKRLATSLAMSSLLLMPGAALAENSCSIDTTGPDSNNTCTINNDQDIDIDNNQDVNVDNDNDQTATSGDATVSGNTTGGDATSGDARNSNTTRTVISFDGLDAGDLDGDDDNGGGGTGGGKLPGGRGSTSGGTGGGVLGASTTGGVGGGVLPDTGSSFPIDVSALRQALAGGSSEDLAAVNRTKGLSAGLLAAAALMSLLGAAGSAVYAAKKEQSL